MENKELILGTRYPTLAFISGGAGQAADGIPPQPFETFCYDSALLQAKVENFSATLWINKYPVVLGQTGQPSKSNKNGTTKTYEIMDYNFFSLGTFQIKVNEKKEEAKFRLKLNEVLDLWEAFTPLGEDRQLVDLTLISHGEVMSFPISVSKKYKEGKSFSATLIKK